jgi:hypothetical protein
MSPASSGVPGILASRSRVVILLFLAVLAAGAACVTALARSEACDPIQNKIVYGRTLFYSADSGLETTATIDFCGNFKTLHRYKGAPLGWTHITPAGGGFILFYNAATGAGRVGAITRDGAYKTLTKYTTRPGWTQVTYAGHGRILFYDGDTGAALTGVVGADGHSKPLRSYTTFERGWTHVVYAAGLLLFYNATTGAGSTGVVDSSGSYTNLQNFKFTPGWTQIASPAKGLLLFYNASNGAGATGVVDSKGGYTNLLDYSTFARGWTAVASGGAACAVDFGTRCYYHLLFYRGDTGAVSVGAESLRGVYTNRLDLSVPAGWTNIATTLR